MSLKVILEDWSDYDSIKIRKRQDVRNFSCAEHWEVEYLIKKIKKSHPAISAHTVRSAIGYCGQQLTSSHPRIPFVQCVTKSLGIPQD
jgi:hypothetical protein